MAGVPFPGNWGKGRGSWKGWEKGHSKRGEEAGAPPLPAPPSLLRWGGALAGGCSAHSTPSPGCCLPVGRQAPARFELFFLPPAAPRLPSPSQPQTIVFCHLSSLTSGPRFLRLFGPTASPYPQLIIPHRRLESDRARRAPLPCPPAHFRALSLARTAFPFFFPPRSAYSEP